MEFCIGETSSIWIVSEKLKPHPYMAEAGYLEIPGYLHKLDYAHNKSEKTSGILHNHVRRFQIIRRIRMVLPKTKDVPLDFGEARF